MAAAPPCKGCVLLDLSTDCNGCVFGRYFTEEKDTDKLRTLTTYYSASLDALKVKLDSLESRCGIDFVKYFLRDLVFHVESFNKNVKHLESRSEALKGKIGARDKRLEEKIDECKRYEADNLKLTEYVKKLTLTDAYNEYIKDKSDSSLADLFAKLPPTHELWDGEFRESEHLIFSTPFLDESLKFLTDGELNVVSDPGVEGIGKEIGVNSLAVNVAGPDVAGPSSQAVDVAGPLGHAIQVKQLSQWHGHGRRGRRTRRRNINIAGEDAAPSVDSASLEGGDYVDVDAYVSTSSSSEEDESDPDYVPKEK